jgi:hypothetical protein
MNERKGGSADRDFGFGKQNQKIDLLITIIQKGGETYGTKNG